MFSAPSDTYTPFPGLLSGDKEKKEGSATPMTDCRESFFPVGCNLLPCLDACGLTERVEGPH